MARCPLDSSVALKGEYKEAESLFRRSLEIDEDVYGPDHRDVAIDLNNMGSLSETLVRELPNFSRLLSIEISRTSCDVKLS